MRYIKPVQLPPNPIILFDDRERKPWNFLASCWPMEKHRLKIGDYTVKGFEDLIAIEKKSGLEELLTNLGKKERPRFERFLLKLSEMPIKVMIIEQTYTMDNILKVLKLARKKSNGRCQLTTRTLTFWTAKITGFYGIPMIFLNKQTARVVVPEIIRQCLLRAQLERQKK